MKKKKLLLVGTNNIHTYNYLRLIDGYFDEVLLITNSKREGEKVNAVEFDFSLRDPLSFKGKIKKLSQIIDSYQPDLIHIHQANTCSFYTLYASTHLSIPKIVTAWGSDVLHAPLKGFFYKWMLKYILKKANAFTSDSKFMAEEMRKYLPSKPLEILIANFGIDITDLNLPKENIIYSNRQLHPLYRIDKVIYAFYRFIKNKSNNYWKLVIAANGNEEEHLIQLVKDLKLDDHVYFAGWINKPQNSEWYSKAKIFISIPESDATAISLLEAMSAGCLPVLSDLPANREWIRHNVNGYIADDLESNFIEEALKIDFDNAARMNKEIIAEEGTKNVNREKFFSLYNQLLNVG